MEDFEIDTVAGMDKLQERVDTIPNLQSIQYVCSKDSFIMSSLLLDLEMLCRKEASSTFSPPSGVVDSQGTALSAQCTEPRRFVPKLLLITNMAKTPGSRTNFAFELPFN